MSFLQVGNDGSLTILSANCRKKNPFFLSTILFDFLLHFCKELLQPCFFIFYSKKNSNWLFLTRFQMFSYVPMLHRWQIVSWVVQECVPCEKIQKRQTLPSIGEGKWGVFRLILWKMLKSFQLCCATWENRNMLSHVIQV